MTKHSPIISKMLNKAHYYNSQLIESCRPKLTKKLKHTIDDKFFEKALANKVKSSKKKRVLFFYHQNIFALN